MIYIHRMKIVKLQKNDSYKAYSTYIEVAYFEIPHSAEIETSESGDFLQNLRL